MKRLILSILSLCFFLVAFTQQSDSSSFYYKKALGEKNARLYLVAYNDFEKAIAFNPKNTDAFRQEGLDAVEMNQYEKAKVSFSKVLELEKDDTLAVQYLAKLHFWSHQWPQAVIYAQKAKQLHTGTNWDYVLGKSYYEEEDYGNAFTFLQAAARADTGNAEIPYLIARAFVDMNNYKPAAQYFKRAIQLDPSKAQWIYECALTFAAIPDDKTAITYYLMAAEKGYKTDNDYYDNLSQSYISTGQTQKGLDLLMIVLAKKPADLELLYAVADANYHLARYDSAIDYWDRVLSFDKQNAKALYMIGMAYQKKGDTDKGRLLCDKAIELDPSLKDLKQEKKINM